MTSGLASRSSASLKVFFVFSSSLYWSCGCRTSQGLKDPPKHDDGHLESSLPSFSPRGEFAASFYVFPCSRFVKWCTRTPSRSTPARLRPVPTMAPPSRYCVPPSPCLPLPGAILNHRIEIQRMKTDRTSSPGTFVKESLKFFQIKPAVLYVLPVYVFKVQRRILDRLRWKYAFQYLRFCHQI